MIYVLTYDKPHRKTQDLLFRLKAHGHNVMVGMQRWVERKVHNPLILIRPQKPLQIPMMEFCKEIRCECYYLDEKDWFSDFPFLIGGANILPKEMTEKYSVINAHTGLLPKYRGLDCVKWAIYNGDEVGVTTHIINNQIDSGELIDKRVIPIEYADSFHGICSKVYETELEMLIEAIDKYKNTSGIFNGSYEPYKRMPHKLEMELFDRFDICRKKIVIARRLNEH